MREILVYLLLLAVIAIALAHLCKWLQTIRKHRLSKKVYVLQTNIKSPAYLVLAAILISEITSIVLFVEHRNLPHGIAVVVFALLMILMYQYLRLVYYNGEGFVYQLTHTPYASIRDFACEYDGRFYRLQLRSGAGRVLFKIRENDWVQTMESKVRKT